MSGAATNAATQSAAKRFGSYLASKEFRTYLMSTVRINGRINFTSRTYPSLIPPSLCLQPELNSSVCSTSGDQLPTGGFLWLRSPTRKSRPNSYLET
ncbi:hypothetical protein CcCBS67573_g03353 [Chytriomyces confervae]|uniref:Uncharacterized protein n=1 Tax=Chytriomyces confervae TaxID=246404 RepID=A0A507FGC0_9FUNG|nr:hypothetical protein HDU80_001921 [Chytriomyces hyalinus]TPX75389.1 hypothetical protein CcCBS67573_g03353 [Chytriomyces confervae]